MKTEKIKFAVVGAGRIGKRHIKMIQENHEADLVGIIDIKEKKNLHLEEEKTPFFQSIQDFFKANIPVDVLNIATPNGLHARQALEVLEQKKNVVIEKPMALSKESAEQIIHKALNVSRHVFVVKQNRYSPVSVWLKNLVTSQKLGKIFLVKIDCFWNRDERYYTKNTWHGDKNLDGGTLFTQFSHFIDMMYWLFGDIKNISGTFQDFNHQEMTDFEDTGCLHFEFIHEGMGILNYTTSIWKENLESTITIIGEKGLVKVGGQYMNKVEICRIKNYEMPTLKTQTLQNDYGIYKGSAANHRQVIQNVIDTIKGKTKPTTNSLEGMKVVEIIERMYALKI